MTKKSFGFNGIYGDLINELTFSWLWKITAPAIFLLLVVGVSINLGMATFTDHTIITKFSDLATALLMLFIVFGILFGVIFGIITNLSGIKYRSIALIARIVITSQHPFQSGVGLSYDDLEALKAIGQVEQSAAGWQGGLLSFVVIWFLAENIGLVSTQVNEMVSITQKVQNTHYFDIHSLGWVAGWFLVLLVIGATGFITFKFIYDFLGNEPANRAIIKACEDGQALLRTLEMKDKKKLTIKDKQRIANHCEYTYKAKNKLPSGKLRISFTTKETNNKDYALVVAQRLEAVLSGLKKSK